MSVLIGTILTGLGGTTSGGSSVVGGGTNAVGGSGIIGAVQGIGQNWVGNVTAIIESGFNFSCWGSTHKPADGKAYLQQDIPAITNATGINNNVTNRSLELTFKYLKYYSETTLKMANRFKKCSKQTLQACGNTANTTLQNLISSLGQSIEFVENRTESVVLPFQSAIREEEMMRANTITYPVYRVKSNDSTGNVSGAPYTGVDYDANTGAPIVKSGVVSSNSLFALALGGAGLFYIANSPKKKGKKK